MRRLAVLVLMIPFVLVLPAVPAQAGGFCVMEPLTDRVQNSVDMKDNCFFPMIVRVETGDSVTWKSHDVEAHTVTAPGGWGSGHKEYRNGDKFTFEFNEEGVYPYVCLYHPGMVGAVVVGDGIGAALEDGLESTGGVNGLTSSGSTEGASGSAKSAPTTPAGDTKEGAPVALVAAITALSLVVIVAAGAWARKRFVARESDAIA